MTSEVGLASTVNKKATEFLNLRRKLLVAVFIFVRFRFTETI